MANISSAPSEADPPGPWARVIAHARIPDALKLLLLALLAALAPANTPRRLLRLPRQDWFIFTHTNPNEHPESVLDPAELRRRRRARAELGWLLRGTRNKGMRPSASRAPVLHLAQPARAPPWPPHIRKHPESVTKAPRPAAMTHARSTPPQPRSRTKPLPPAPAPWPNPAIPGSKEWPRPTASSRRTNCARSPSAPTGRA